jgi:hypothetical protein
MITIALVLELCKSERCENNDCFALNFQNLKCLVDSLVGTFWISKALVTSFAEISSNNIIISRKRAMAL